MRLGLLPRADMSEAEIARWEAGRDDWPDDRWQDHCGAPDCDYCSGEVPMGNGIAAKIRRAR